ncbi:MAG TPA: glycosyltransferase [Sulfuricurvum sp.]|nr:glycosyltransferase [Sulfuricurvum sp.]
MRTKGHLKRSTPEHPLFSIVTVVYNGEQHLEQTIRSVLNQNYDNIEYIIIDGASVDGTLQIIRKYEDAIDYWVSEPDNGIYDAMNKGLQCATGDYIGFINADDWYEPDALAHIAESARKNGADFLSAKIRVIDEAGRGVVRAGHFEDWGKNLHHQSSFVRLSLHKRFPFDVRFRYAADRDFFVRMLKQGVSTAFVDTVVANFREGGAGSGLLAYQGELFYSNLKNVGLRFALRRYFINTVGRTLFNWFHVKR